MHRLMGRASQEGGGSGWSGRWGAGGVSGRRSQDVSGFSWVFQILMCRRLTHLTSLLSISRATILDHIQGPCLSHPSPGQRSWPSMLKLVV